MHIFGVGIKSFALPLLGLTPYSLLFSFIALMRIISLNKHRSFSLIHSIDTGYAGLAGLLASKILRIKFLVHSHCSRAPLLKSILLLRCGIVKYFIPPYEKFETYIDKIVSRNADLVITVSNEIGEYICGLGVPSKKIVTIPMGISASSFELKLKDREEVRCELGIRRTAFVIGYIGRIDSPSKRVDTLLRAFSVIHTKPCTNSFLVVVGDDVNGNLENRVRSMGVQSVILTGFRKDVKRILAGLDVFVLPSLSEGCPFSLLEAMAGGKAIVASDIPSIREIVEDGKEALLFNPREVNALVRALSRLCNNEDLRNALGKSARKKVLQYKEETGLCKIADIYKQFKGIEI